MSFYTWHILIILINSIFINNSNVYLLKSLAIYKSKVKLKTPQFPEVFLAQTLSHWGGSWQAIRTALLEIGKYFANPNNRIKHIADLRPYRRS
jgi:hypothetical protein